MMGRKVHLYTKRISGVKPRSKVHQVNINCPCIEEININAGEGPTTEEVHRYDLEPHLPPCWITRYHIHILTRNFEVEVEVEVNQEKSTDDVELIREKLIEEYGTLVNFSDSNLEECLEKIKTRIENPYDDIFSRGE